MRLKPPNEKKGKSKTSISVEKKERKGKLSPPLRNRGRNLKWEKRGGGGDHLYLRKGGRKGRERRANSSKKKKKKKKAQEGGEALRRGEKRKEL